MQMDQNRKSNTESRNRHILRREHIYNIQVCVLQKYVRNRQMDIEIDPRNRMIYKKSCNKRFLIRSKGNTG